MLRRDFFKTIISISTIAGISAEADTSFQSIEKYKITPKNKTIVKKNIYKDQRRQQRKLELARKPKNNIYLLKMYNPNTKEILISKFKKNEKISTNTMDKIDYFFRDFRESKTKSIDEQLIKKLANLFQKTKTGKYIVIHSAYRTKKTNKLLKELGYKTAKNSMHLKGKALDFHVKGKSAESLFKMARIMKFGGVGYYPNQDFIHLDTGRVRYWIS